MSSPYSDSILAAQVANLTVNYDWRTEDQVLSWISAGYTGSPEILAIARFEH